MLREAVPPARGDGGGAPPAELSAMLARERAALMHRSFEFEQRLQRSAEAERGALAGGAGLRELLQGRLAREASHVRSRSAGALPDPGAAPWHPPVRAGAAAASSAGAAAAASAGAAAAASTGAGAGLTSPQRLARAEGAEGSGGSSSGSGSGREAAGRPPLPTLARRASLEARSGGGGGSEAPADRQPSSSAQWLAGLVTRRPSAPAAALAHKHERQPLLAACATPPPQRREESDWEAVAPPPKGAAGAAEGAGLVLTGADGSAEAVGGEDRSGHLLAPDSAAAAAGLAREPGTAGFRGPPRVDVVAADLTSSGGKVGVGGWGACHAARTRACVLGRAAGPLRPPTRVSPPARPPARRAPLAPRRAAQDWVTYRIRVEDASGAWSVGRRYRNFEV